MLKVCQLSLLCLLTLVFVAGCGDIKGSWILREHQPYLEKKDYKLAKITFFPGRQNSQNEGNVRL
ncbi:MAG: hypothetical protein ACYTBZ_24540 [Planctomycetota bacterium]